MSPDPSPRFQDGLDPFLVTAKTSAGEPVDFRRAAALMDPDLLRQAFARFGRPGPWSADPCVPSDYLARVWGYYCHLHAEHLGWSFTPDTFPRWYEPSLAMGLIDMEPGVLMKIQRVCSGECLFARSYGLIRGVANDR